MKAANMVCYGCVYTYVCIQSILQLADSIAHAGRMITNKFSTHALIEAS